MELYIMTLPSKDSHMADEMNGTTNQPPPGANQPSPLLTAEIMKIVLDDPEKTGMRRELANRLHQKEVRAIIPVK